MLNTKNSCGSHTKIVRAVVVNGVAFVLWKVYIWWAKCSLAYRFLYDFFNYFLKLEINSAKMMKFVWEHLPAYQFPIKDTLSGLRQFLETESPLKWWKMLFTSPQKLFSFSTYLTFYLDFFDRVAKRLD